MSGDGERGADLTGLLQAWRRGNSGARDELLERVYAHLKRIAAAQLRGERAGHTLQPTALVHEAYLRLINQARVDWRDRAHFFGLVAATMRRVLIDHARRRGSRKRQHAEEVPGLAIAGSVAPEVDLLDLDRALERLAGESARAAQVVEMRYFAGLEIDEVAECLEISPATVKRDWEFARTWMRAELREPA
ncbi:MAG: sigma-70 family RNA polymerase sigma factor [Thermoanaerobaculia bacterium]|nr:sigma-70 family RNA polymerase sigma factor [Thermoanaerobaculia bacterium]